MPAPLLHHLINQNEYFYKNIKIQNLVTHFPSLPPTCHGFDCVKFQGEIKSFSTVIHIPLPETYLKPPLCGKFFFRFVLMRFRSFYLLFTLIVKKQVLRLKYDLFVAEMSVLNHLLETEIWFICGRDECIKLIAWDQNMIYLCRDECIKLIAWD